MRLYKVVDVLVAWGQVHDIQFRAEHVRNRSFLFQQRALVAFAEVGHEIARVYKYNICSYGSELLNELGQLFAFE